MPTLLSGISVALQAMMASQHATRVIEHNVANANTPGYHRQQALLNAARAYPPAGVYTGGSFANQIGAGVQVESIQRFNTDFLDASVRRETGSAAYWTRKGELLASVEAQMMEVQDGGLLSRLDDFWEGWRALEADPSNSALRTDLIERTRSLADGFNSRDQQLRALRLDMDKSLAPIVAEVNAGAARVAQLNTEILAIQATGNQPNDLIDERARLLESLSKQAGATVHFQENGQALMAIGAHALVVGGSALQMQAQVEATTGLTNITWTDNGQAVNFARSELAAILEVRDQGIGEQIAGLDALAAALITKVNEVHHDGYGLTGNTQRYLFYPGPTDAAAMTAANITLSPDITGPDDIAAANSPDSPGDGSNAADLADLQDFAMAALQNRTLNAAYNQQVTNLGLDIREAGKNAGSRRLVLDALEEQRQSIGGVSLDEEAANLARYQRTYQAAARLMTAMDEMLDRVINGMGRVGL